MFTSARPPGTQARSPQANAQLRPPRHGLYLGGPGRGRTSRPENPASQWRAVPGTARSLSAQTWLAKPVPGSAAHWVFAVLLGTSRARPGVARGLQAASSADDPKAHGLLPRSFPQQGTQDPPSPRCSGAMDSRSENRTDKILLGLDLLLTPSLLLCLTLFQKPVCHTEAKSWAPCRNQRAGKQPPAEPGVRPPDVLAPGRPCPKGTDQSPRLGC